jgi:hypothetical protein
VAKVFFLIYRHKQNKTIFYFERSVALYMYGTLLNVPYKYACSPTFLFFGRIKPLKVIEMGGDEA